MWGSLSADLMAINRGPFWQGPLRSSPLIGSDRPAGGEEELQAGDADRFSPRAKKFESKAAAAADISTVGTFSIHQAGKEAQGCQSTSSLRLHVCVFWKYIFFWSRSPSQGQASSTHEQG